MGNKKNEEKINELFEKLVPASGKAENKAGELVRACCRIGYRYFNDGDIIGIGYGRETVNPAARYLIAEGNGDIADTVCKMWECYDEKKYESLLDDLEGYVLKYIETKPELMETETDDMWDYRDEDEDVDTYEDEDEYEDDWEEEDEDEADIYRFYSW